jgi:asparagine synthase (glutamine-hydrolysing)
MSRRGPDGGGLVEFPSVVLGHRRLAIFDLSDAGRQPMLTPDGRLGVVFNGAIYNFRELRVALESAGATFRSQTDTEVLLAGYRHWGMEGLLERLRGMFAFGLWDDDRKIAWLARDRLGVKPMAYSMRGDALVFASTVRALSRAGFGDSVSPRAMARVLEFGFVPEDCAIYDGIRKLPPGCLLEWRAESPADVRVRRYWRQPPMETRSIPFDEAVDQAETLLLQAVRRRLDADVPVAALLSGGIDSALVCWAMKELGANLKAFTAGTPGQASDETASARDAARALGLDHHVLTLDTAAEPRSEELAHAYAEPFPCSSAFGMLRLSKAIKDVATVVLTGDGGDDVFLGYEGHLHFWRAQQLARSLPKPLAASWAAIRMRGATLRGPARGAVRRGMRFLDYASGGLGAVQAAHDSRSFYERWCMSGDLLKDSAAWEPIRDWSPSAGRELLQEYLDYQLEHRFAGEYLTKVDGGAMWYALEARSPFLDQDLWEFAARLPASIRLHGGDLKAVLRALARRRIGHAMSRLGKRGFTIPAEKWLVTAWRRTFEEQMEDLRLAEQGFVDAKAVRNAWKAALAAGQAPRQLWYVHAVETWLRHEEAARVEARAP